MLLTRLQLAIIGIIAALFLVAAVVQTVRLDGFLWLDGVTDKLADCTRDRDNLIDKLDTLAEQSRKRIEETGRQVDRVVKQGNPQAERVEKAPLPGGCKSPPEVLGADL